MRQSIKKQSIKAVLFLFAIILFYSCEDKLLNLAPISEVSTENYYQSESDFNAASNAAYNGLQTLNNANWKMQEIRADNAYTGRNEGGFDIDNFTLTKQDVIVADFWQVSYNTVFRVNIILDKIEGTEFSQEYKDRIIGQAKFIRALLYFDLVRCFGDVPLITNVISLSESYEAGRDVKEAVYQQIISDLEDAVALLPVAYESGADIGRATKGAASGLLGKVCLTNGEYDKAKSALEDVINSDQYQLLASYADIWKIENQNSKEIVFAIQYSDGMGNGNSFNYYFAPQIADVDIYQGSGLRMIRPTAEIIRAFEEGDTRINPTLAPYYINPDSGDTINSPYFRKFLADQLNKDGGQDWPILRYSDILLLYAEVLDLSGDTENAINYLNSVRSRAFNGNQEKLYAVSEITSSSQFRDLLLHERRVELSMENHRWFDLLRFNKAEEFMQSEIRVQSVEGETLQTYQINMQEYQRLYPIPAIEIEKNSKLTPNPGY